MGFTLRLLTACLAYMAAATPAAAAPPLRDVGPATPDAGSGRTLLAGDGTHVAYSSAPARVRVIDGRLRELALVPAPEGCGAWGDFGGGSLLWYCGMGPPGGVRGVVYDLDSQRLTQLPPPALPNDTATSDSPAWRTIGKHWLGIYYISSGVRLVAYVNRGTGRMIPAITLIDNVRDKVPVTPDLDGEDLLRPLCAPLRPRWTLDDRGNQTPAPFAYERPFGATLSNTGSGTRLLLGRCGDRRQTVLSRCRGICTDPVIGDRVVAWVEGSSTGLQAGRLFARLIDRARTWSWRVSLPRRVDYATDPLVAVVGRRVFVLERGKLRSVRLPAVKTLAPPGRPRTG